MAALTPVGLINRAIARHREETGHKWTDLTPAQRERWLARVLPAIRAEHGIAVDAEWRDGAWQAPGQFALFVDEGEHTSPPARGGIQ